MPTLARVTVTGPIRPPRRFGLFSVAEVETSTDPHIQAGVQWVADACEPPATVSDGCPCPDLKTWTPGRGVQDATPFAVVGSWQCAKLGVTLNEAVARARTQLEGGEQQAVEREVWEGTNGAGPRFAHPDTVVIGEVGCATDLLAAIESYASAFMVQPVVHAPRPVLAHLAADHLIEKVASGARLETPWGTPVAGGPGYAMANTGPDGTPAPEGSWWVYATGPIKVWRGPVIALPEPPEQGFVRCSNEFVATAERVYVVGWDCFTAAVLYTPCCPCPGTPAPAPPAPSGDVDGQARGQAQPSGGTP